MLDKIKVLTSSTREALVEMKVHRKQQANILKEEKEECQSQSVTTPNGHYKEEGDICYHEEKPSSINSPQQYLEAEPSPIS